MLSEQVKSFNKIKTDNKAFNDLVEETTQIMKAEIIQSVMNRHDRRRFAVMPKYKVVGREKSPLKIKTVDKDKKIDVKLYKKKYKINPKYEKLVKNDLNIEKIKTVGNVVADRFSEKPFQIKNKIVRDIRHLSKVDPKIYKNIEENKFDILNGPPVIKQVKLEAKYPRLIQKKYFIDLIKFTPIEIYWPDFPLEETEPERPVKSVELKLHSVKCIDETGSGWLGEMGQDEINMGGVTIDDKEVSRELREFEVYHDFDDGDIKRYDPPRVLKRFTRLDSEYPKIFSAYLSLAEKDAGGFSSFLSELYEAIKDELELIVTALGVAAGALIGSEVGGVVGSLAGPIGTVIGAAAGAVLGALIGWLIKAFKDDIFTPQMTMVAVEQSDPGENAVVNTPISELNYSEHNGRYRAKVSWTIKY